MRSHHNGWSRTISMVMACIALPMFLAALPYTTHSGIITTQTWTTGTTHLVSADLTIADDHTLTIESGVIVKVAAGVTISVQGTLDVNGASGNGNAVIFTSSDDNTVGETIDGSDGVPSAGDWDGIYCWGNDCCTFYDANLFLDYSSVLYAGKNGANDAAILWTSDAHGSITNSTVRYSQTNGVWVYYSNSAVITIDNNTISDNGGHGILSNGWSRQSVTNNTLSNNTGKAAYLNRVDEATVTGNTGSGNGINGIEFYWSELAYNGTWGTSSTLPIILDDVISVNDNITLTINAGSIIKGKSNSRLSVSGTLDANGTAGSNIVFTSYKDDTYGGNTDGAEATPAGGDWKGINMYGSDANDGIGYFDYCRVRYGMAPTWGGTYGNVMFDQSTEGNFTNSISEYAGGAGISVESCSPTITGSTIEHNGTYGIYVQGGTASAPLITNNSINGNGDYAVYLNSIVPTAYSGNSGSGNAKDRFGWYGTVAASVTHSGTLPFELIYPVSISSGQTLTISSGAVYFENQYVSGAGNFTLASGVLMETKALYGIYSGTSYGCVLVEGTRTFDPGARYRFDRGSGQYTGDAFPATVAELTVANTTPLTLSNDVTVSGTLHMTSGTLTTGANTVTVGTGTATPGQVDAGGGTISGTIKRWFDAVTISNAVFPVGTASKYLPATISFTVAPSTGGTITAKFTAADPGSNGLPLTDGAANIVNRAAEGYWTLSAGDALSGGTYSLDLRTDAFSGVSDHTKLRIMKRANAAAAWSAEGTHAAGTGTNAAAVAHRAGLTAFSEFAVGSTVDNPLPVELTAFSAVQNGRNVGLQWNTATEANNLGFEVQRSTVIAQNADADTCAWVTIGFVAGHGTTNAPQSYAFTDASVRGTVRYRLKQVDKDGAVSYSAIVEVTADSAPHSAALLEAYPNPFNPATVIHYRTGAAVVTSLIVYDIMGRAVATLVNGPLEQGEHTAQFDASALASGPYLCVLRSGSVVSTTRLLLMK